MEQKMIHNLKHLGVDTEGHASIHDVSVRGSYIELRLIHDIIQPGVKFDDLPREKSEELLKSYIYWLDARKEKITNITREKFDEKNGEKAFDELQDDLKVCLIEAYLEDRLDQVFSAISAYDEAVYGDTRINNKGELDKDETDLYLKALLLLMLKVETLGTDGLMSKIVLFKTDGKFDKEKIQKEYESLSNIVSPQKPPVQTFNVPNGYPIQPVALSEKEQFDKTFEEMRPIFYNMCEKLKVVYDEMRWVFYVSITKYDLANNLNVAIRRSVNDILRVKEETNRKALSPTEIVAFEAESALTVNVIHEFEKTVYNLTKEFFSGDESWLEEENKETTDTESK